MSSTTRRSFVQGLAAIPVAGPAIALLTGRAEPAAVECPYERLARAKSELKMAAAALWPDAAEIRCGDYLRDTNPEGVPLTYFLQVHPDGERGRRS